MLFVNTKGHCFLTALIHIKRFVKMSWKWVSLSIGAPLGNLEGICLPGHFERKESISGFPSWTQRTLKILNLQAIRNFDKGTGFS
jgi:hypothetical protein